MKILIAEDDANLRKWYELYFEGKEDIEADIVEDGAFAMRYYESMPYDYDLLILDGEMPFVSGYDAIKRIRQKDEKTPIILLTEATGDNIKAFCEIQNVIYLHKNLNTINDLEKIIRGRK